MALAVAVMAPAAAPHFFPVAPAAPRGPVLQAAAPPAGKPFARICRGDQVLDSRPDPAWVSQSFADDHCQSPPLPPAVDGATATREQVVAAMASAGRYAAAADAFQRCVSDFVAARRAGDRPLTQAQFIIENHRLLVSRRAQQRAADQADVAVNAFNEYGSGCEDHG